MDNPKFEMSDLGHEVAAQTDDFLVEKGHGDTRRGISQLIRICALSRHGLSLTGLVHALIMVVRSFANANALSD